jgi:hypothetical protein
LLGCETHYSPCLQNSHRLGHARVFVLWGPIHFRDVVGPQGRVLGWGNSSYGQTNSPSDLNDVIAVGANGSDGTVGYSVALRRNGTITAWGYNGRFGVTNVPAGLSNAISISAGCSM